MKEVLAPLAGIAGVTGAALFAPDDRCLASTLQPPYEEMLIERVMRTLRQALVTFNVTFESENTWSGLFLRCEGGHLVVKRVGDNILLVFGLPTMNVAMVNVGLNVAAMKLKSLEGVPVAPPATYPTGSGSPPTQPTRVATPTSPPPRSGAVPPPPSSDAIPEPLGRSSQRAIPTSQALVGSGPPSLSWPHAVQDHVGNGVLSRTTIELVLRVLAKHLGPAAKQVMRDELVALGLAPNAVPFSSYSDLVDQMARHISDTGRRTAFVVEAELVGIHTAVR